MNILFISPNSPEISVGGVERYIKNLVSFCSKKQGYFTFLLPRSAEESLKGEDNIKIYREDFLNLTFRRTKESGKVKFSQREIQKIEGFFSTFS